MEVLLEGYSHQMKDVLTKTIVNDVISILCTLTLTEKYTKTQYIFDYYYIIILFRKSENNDIIVFSGPDCLNMKRITNE